jgi:hypothetical protein
MVLDLRFTILAAGAIPNLGNHPQISQIFAEEPGNFNL